MGHAAAHQVVTTPSPCRAHARALNAASQNGYAGACNECDQKPSAYPYSNIQYTDWQRWTCHQAFKCNAGAPKLDV